MHRSIVFFVLGFSAAGCEVSLDSQKGDTFGDGGDSCAILEEGSWTLTGDAWSDSPSATLNMNEDNCAFSLTNWSSADDMPTGGTIDDLSVNLNGSTYWAGCSGTVGGGDYMSGTCGDGEVWTISGE